MKYHSEMMTLQGYYIYRNHICNDVISMNIVIDYVVSNILILSCCSIMHDLQNNGPLNFN